LAKGKELSVRESSINTIHNETLRRVGFILPNYPD
jgi:hypothetical protein